MDEQGWFLQRRERGIRGCEGGSAFETELRGEGCWERARDIYGRRGRKREVGRQELGKTKGKGEGGDGAIEAYTLQSMSLSFSM